MPKFNTAAASEGEWVPPYDENDLVEASVSGVELVEFDWNNPKTGKVETIRKLRWSFMVTEEGRMKGKDITGDTTTSFAAHPNCKAYNWYTKISGHAPGEGEEADTDDLLGLPCLVVIGHQRDKKDDSKIWLRVKDVFPKKGRASAPAPSAAPF